VINKQSIWFVTLFSLILVLSIYYVTLNDSSLQSILDDFNKNTPSNTSTPVNVNVEESTLLVSLRVQEDESVLKEMDDLQSILLDGTKTSEEKNEAYNSLQELNQKKGDEEKIEKKIKEEYGLDSFAKIKKDTISIVVANNEHSTTKANSIIRSVQELFDRDLYITVKFQNA